MLTIAQCHRVRAGPTPHKRRTERGDDAMLMCLQVLATLVDAGQISQEKADGARARFEHVCREIQESLARRTQLQQEAAALEEELEVSSGQHQQGAGSGHVAGMPGTCTACHPASQACKQQAAHLTMHSCHISTPSAVLQKIPHAIFILQ